MIKFKKRQQNVLIYGLLSLNVCNTWAVRRNQFPRKRKPMSAIRYTRHIGLLVTVHVDASCPNRPRLISYLECIYAV